VFYKVKGRSTKPHEQTRNFVFFVGWLVLRENNNPHAAERQEEKSDQEFTSHDA
jgi:hypothetical protein